MKKHFKLLFILGLLIPIKINAQTLYSDYYFLEESEELYEESETLKREERVLYNNYYIERDKESYYLKDDNPDDYPYIDETDIKEKINYYSEYLPNMEGPYTIHRLYGNEKVKFLELNEFNTSNVNLNSLTIYCKDNIVPYNILENNYKFGNTLFFYNFFKIELFIECHQEDLEIQAEFTAPLFNDVEFNIIMTGDHINYYFFKSLAIANNYRYFYNIKFMDYENFEHFPTYNSSYNCFITKDIFYKYYSLKRINTNTYTTEAINNHFLDLNDFKRIYSYYQRNVIETKDEIIIDMIINEDKINHYEIKRNIRKENKNEIIASNLSNIPLKKDLISNNDLNKSLLDYQHIFYSILIIMLFIYIIIAKKKNRFCRNCLKRSKHYLY